MLRLSRLPGAEFKRLRSEFGISRSEVADALGVSESTVVRAEAQPALHEDFSDALAPHVLADYEAGLELGLTVAAMQIAEQQGLRAADALADTRVYWRPAVHRWAARFRRFVPKSMGSQALHLCELLGLDPEEGIARCGVCESREIEPPRIAVRQCFFCKSFLCVSDACGGDFVPDDHHLAFAYPVACVTCLARRPLLRPSTAIGYLPGQGSVGEQLAARFDELQRVPKIAELARLRDVVKAARDETSARREAIRAALHSEGALTDPQTRPDFFMNLHAALGEATRDLQVLGKLFAQVEGALSGTNTEREP